MTAELSLAAEDDSWTLIGCWRWQLNSHWLLKMTAEQSAFNESRLIIFLIYSC